MKVARIAADLFGYALTDRDIVEMVTTQPGCAAGALLAPSGRPARAGRVRRRHGRARSRLAAAAWKRIVAATERDVALVVIDGVARYGDATLMDARRRATDVHDDRRRRAATVALPDPDDTTKAWSWAAIMATLDAVQKRPAGGDRTAPGPGGARVRGSRPTPTLELFLDMPDTRRSGRAGPPKNPATVTIPQVPTLEHDAAYFDLLDGVARSTAGSWPRSARWFRT